jgi:ribosomal protein L30/L7E
MPTRVRIVHRRVEDIRVAVVALRIARVGDERVRADKPPHLRQVVARVHVDQAQVVGAGVGDEDIARRCPVKP